MQYTDSKNDGEAEETARTEAATVDSPTDDAQIGAQNPSENGDSDDETLVEWIESAENAVNEEGDQPDEADFDDSTAALEAKTAELAEQLAESRDQLLRKAAEFENFRKRMNQEKQNAIEYANQSLLLDIIPVIDDFERAIQSAEASQELAELPTGKAMLDGITMIEKRLVSQLEAKWGLKRFNSAGELFDPNIHEAMMMEKSGEIEEPVVVEDFVKGYMLKDRVIRAAKVKVLMPEERD